jgi:hypothetical protein
MYVAKKISIIKVMVICRNKEVYSIFWMFKPKFIGKECSQNHYD